MPQPRNRAPVSHADLLHRIQPALSGDDITAAALKLGPCTTEHVLQAMSQPVTRANEMAVAARLKALGYRKTRMAFNGHRAHVFLPPGP